MDEQLEFARQIAARLTGAGIPYMMTGSMAQAVYATPRMTRDVDFVVECTARDVDRLVRLFESDCYIERSAVAEAIATRGMFNVIHHEWIIKGDFVVRKDDPYRQTEFQRRREITVQGTPLAVVAPEDLILSKLNWALESGLELHRRDAREIVEAGTPLDWPYLERWAVHLPRCLPRLDYRRSRGTGARAPDGRAVRAGLLARCTADSTGTATFPNLLDGRKILLDTNTSMFDFVKAVRTPGWIPDSLPGS